MTYNRTPKALITSMKGGEEGALNAVRSLGKMGIPVVVLSEAKNSSVFYSKYVSEIYYLNNFSINNNVFIDFMLDYGKKQTEKPVVIPTADPDLLQLNMYREPISMYYHLAISDSDIINLFVNKKSFYSYAKKNDLPIPNTIVPSNIYEIYDIQYKLVYPIVIKPSNPLSWNENVRRIVQYKKVCIINNHKDLVNVCQKIYKYTDDIILQEYIPGKDSSHFDLHVYIDKNNILLGYFVGQKIRLQPPYAGTGCYVKANLIQELVNIGINILNKTGFKGLANIDFKKDFRTGEYVLLEINPRLSQWCILATECGVNFPFIAYSDLIGVEQMLNKPIKNDISYVDFKRDLKAFFEYNRNGDLKYMSWLNTILFGKNIYQYYRKDDINPYIYSCYEIFRNKIVKIFHK